MRAIVKTVPIVMPLWSLICSFAIPPGAESPASYTKQYAIEGFELEAGFTPDKAECILGEPIFITFSVKNLSQKAHGFFVGGDNRGSVRHNRFHVTAVGADGEPVKDPYSYDNFGGQARDVILQPAENYAERLYLGFWCAFEKPGEYDVTCKRDLTSDGGGKYPSVPVIATFKLKIHPFDREKMRGVIADLGKKLREGDQQAVYEATLGLAPINDEEVIPHLAVSLTQGDFQNKLPAVKAISRFSTGPAAEALTGALKDPDDAISRAAGEALRKNGMTDRAVDALLKELGDPESSVRAWAARALGYTGAERALDPLIKAMEDATPAVRYAVAEAAGILGHKRAIQLLKNRLDGLDMGMRVAAAKGLMALGEPVPVESLVPVIKNTTDMNDQNFHESIRLIRLEGGERAAPALISCLKFDDPSLRNSYNFFLMQGIEASPGGPKCFSIYHHDPNVDGTPEQIEENRRIFAALKAWLAEFEQKEKEASSLRETGAPLDRSDRTDTGAGSAAEKGNEASGKTESFQPEWRKKFGAVYRLNEGEILKHIPEPFMPERSDFFDQQRRLHPDPFGGPGEGPPRDPDGNIFLWDGQEVKDYGTNPGALEVMLRALGVRPYEMRGPDNLLKFPLRGDWVLYEKSPVDKRLEAFARILKEKFGHSVRFEKRRLEEEVIVVAGKLNIHPLKAERWEELMSDVYHFLPEPARRPVHVYVDSLETGRFRVLYADTYLSGLLDELAGKLGRKVVDETEPSDILVGWSLHETFNRDYIEKEPSRLDRLLKNLSRQTSLQFRRERRPVEVWFVRELPQSSNTDGRPEQIEENRKVLEPVKAAH